jgi:hypothetical protein
MSSVVNLKLQAQDSIKQYIVLLRDGTRVHVKARGFFLSDCYTYRFSLEDHDIMDAKLRANKIPKISFEISKKDVHSVYESGQVEFFPSTVKATPKRNPRKPAIRKKK